MGAHHLYPKHPQKAQLCSSCRPLRCPLGPPTRKGAQGPAPRPLPLHCDHRQPTARTPRQRSHPRRPGPARLSRLEAPAGAPGLTHSSRPHQHRDPSPPSCPEASSELGMCQLSRRPQAEVSTSVPSGAGGATPGQASSSRPLEHPSLMGRPGAGTSSHDCQFASLGSHRLGPPPVFLLSEAPLRGRWPPELPSTPWPWHFCQGRPPHRHGARGVRARVRTGARPWSDGRARRVPPSLDLTLRQGDRGGRFGRRGVPSSQDS